MTAIKMEGTTIVAISLSDLAVQLADDCNEEDLINFVNDIAESRGDVEFDEHLVTYFKSKLDKYYRKEMKMPKLFFTNQEYSQELVEQMVEQWTEYEIIQFIDDLHEKICDPEFDEKVLKHLKLRSIEVTQQRMINESKNSINIR